MKHLWKPIEPGQSPGVYATYKCKRCDLCRRFEPCPGGHKWMYYVNGLYRLRGPVCAKKADMTELEGKTFRWRDYDFKLEPNALLRPWWTVDVPDPHRLNTTLFSFHVGPRIEGGDLPFQAIVTLPSKDEGLEPFELAHAVGKTPKEALDVVSVIAEHFAAHVRTMMKVINDSVARSG